ncbi:uncharacterized protein LOC127865958 isoform X2 [Dreissena polymorpha]|uniref:uncharacterized protein LOC127865958 isoform X2 n=1 Tax=Dreissena polymorpha TaxID=45954 RepID=UPI002263E0F3|nr:uncharacterized protein LOC127865958 isoform X2 [Dreissena polymorpha]
MLVKPTVFTVLGLLQCYAVSATDIRLVGDKTPYSGRLEVKYNGKWGTVCDDDFTVNSAKVVCRMLGFTDTETAKYIQPSVYGPGNGNILLDSLNCLGNETDIADCSHQAWEATDCSNSEDIGVDCRTHMRIEQGSTPHDGQVEVNITGIWQPLCADNFTQSEANVICRMLGYSANGSYVMSARSTADLSSISSTAYNCTGNEIDISMCRKRLATCSASTVAAVNCTTPIRIVNGTSQQSGRVEVFHNDAWGTVCDDNFDDMEAKVICRMLGFGTSNAKSLTGAYYGEGQGKIVVDDMYCQGEEVDISDCKSRPWGTSNTCHHSEDAAVECNTELRLIDGPTEYSGRLELRQKSEWKTVCSNHFDNKTAQIVCNMLGFERSNISIYTDGRFHGNGAPMINHGYACSGNETDIANCKHTNVSLPCTAVGINCYSNTPLRILNGTTMFNGRVEIYETLTSSNGQWKGLCFATLKIGDAVVLCKMLGFPTTTPTIHDAVDQYKLGGVFSLLSGLGCNGTETDVSGCVPQHKWNEDPVCPNSRHAAINCAPNSTLRLYNGTSIKSGRVEVLYNGSWIRVCRHSEMDRGEIDLICRQLGFNQSGYQIVPSTYGSQQGIGLLECRGTESDISDCRSKNWGVMSNCTPETIACNSSVRLVNGSSARSGRVEVLHRGKWGTICSDGFNISDANVVCRKAGIRLWNASVLLNSPFGRGVYDQILDNVSCKGDESDLSECKSSPWNVTHCGNGNVATVDCRVQDTPMRLFGGTTQHSGRVDIFYEGNWMSYCREYSSQTQANLEILCQQLGYNISSDARYLTDVYAYNGMSLFHDLSCQGNESDISLCPSSDWGSYSCSSSYYTAIDCLSPIQLNGGWTDYMGYVQITNKRVTSSVCTDNLTAEMQTVFCNMLDYNFSRNHVLVDQEHFRPGFIYNNNLVNDIQCSGDEKDFQQCRASNWNLTQCKSGNPAYVRCNSPVRLTNTTNIYTGIVEIYQNSSWINVCFDNGIAEQNTNNAHVVCLMLGFSNSLSNVTFVTPHNTHSLSMNCFGSEVDIARCRNVTIRPCSRIIAVTCPTDMSLVNGRTKYMGTLTVRTGSRSNPILGFADSNTIKTVCRLLGYNFTRDINQNPAKDFLRNKFMNEDIYSVVSKLRCHGNETDIAECTESTVDAKSYQMDLGINCQTAIQLTDGEPYIHGVLNVKVQQTWYTTCSEGFEIEDAYVVCRMLGHKHVQNAVNSNSSVVGNETSFNGHLQCRGDEVDISQCRGYTEVPYNCTSAQGVKIDCVAQVKLRDGLSESQGWVEVFYNGTNASICPPADVYNVGTVICRSAGFKYTYGNPVNFQNRYKTSTNFTIVNLRCTGFEKSITECDSDPWMSTTCNAAYPLEIECKSRITLEPGVNTYFGWIRVYFLDPDFYSTQFASVCAEGFGQDEAKVMCNEIGAPTRSNAAVIKNNKYGSHYNFVIEHLNCTGEELDVQECGSEPWTESHPLCKAGDTTVTINCQSQTNVSLKGPDSVSGLVEIYFEGQRYTMCGGTFGVREAAVVCQSLGFKVGIPSVILSTQSALVYQMDCGGHETDISQCEFTTRPWGYNRYPWTPGECSQYSDYTNYNIRAGVKCSNQRVRLVSDVNDYQGRVEFQYLGVWGTVCFDRFTQNDATVICNSGGYSGPRSGNITIHNSTKYDSGSGSLIIDELKCKGNESDLDECASYPWTKNATNCPLLERDVGVNCRPETPLRLVGGNTYSGIIEIEYNNTWGTICDREFDDNDAKVICRMKGYNTESLIVLRNGFYGHGNGSVFISNLACKGTEPDISECAVGNRTSDEKARWGNPSELCSHVNDVAIQCNTPVRLREGWTIYSGVVEVYIRGVWQRVCKDNFTIQDSKALCKQAGKIDNYNGNITIHNEQFFNIGFNETHVGGFGCLGNEDDLYECGAGKWVWNTQSCPSRQNVALNCRANTGFRLMNGLVEANYSKLPVKGRVEVQYKRFDNVLHKSRDDKWGTICDDQFGDEDALVLCSMKGFDFGKVFKPEMEYERTGNETINIDDLECLGVETDVSECKAREWGTHNCRHDEDVSITCNNQTNINPCDKENYKRLPNLELRVVNYNTTAKPINDNKLSLNWYYVGNNTLPDKEPPLNRCATVYPIFSTDPSPNVNDGIKTIKAVQAANNTVTYDLKAKNCGAFFVYRLGPTFTKDSGYCFGIGSTVPPPSFVASSIQTVMNYNDTSIWFICKFNHDQNENLVYQVEWHVDGNSEQIVTKQFCNATDMTTCNLQHTDMENINVGMGSNVFCAVRAFNSPGGQPGQMSILSAPFFVGIQILTPRVTVHRGEVKSVEMKMTVPIICSAMLTSQGPQCNLHLDYFTPDDGTCPDAVGNFPTGCSKELNLGHFGSIFSVDVSAAESSVYGVAGKFSLNMQIPKTRGVALLTVPYKLPVIEVEVLPEENKQWRGKICSARNDPHMYTFDGREYEHHEAEGDYILYRHDIYKNVEIQHRIANCTDGNSKAKCTCGVAVKAGRDVYVINVCNGYIDIGYRQCWDKALTVKKENDYTYTIYLPYGTAVRARIDRAPFMGREGGRVLDISVNPSIKDGSGNSTGLCGSLNQDPRDDFDNETTFIQKWKVTENDSLFSHEMYRRELDPWVFQSCTCKMPNNGSSTFTCESNVGGCAQGTVTGFHGCGELLNSRSLRSLRWKRPIPIVKIPVLHQRTYVRTKRDTIRFDKEAALKHCNAELTSTQNLCSKIPFAHTNFSINSCVLDFLLSNDTLWTSLSNQSMQDTCKNEVARNSSVIEASIAELMANGSEESSEELRMLRVLQNNMEEVDNMCMHSCSDKGECINGTCHCLNGYGSVDCSLDLTKAPIITGILNEGLCDKNHTDCSRIFVFGGEFTDTNLTCRLKSVHVDASGHEHTHTTVMVKGHAETLIETVCPLEGVRTRREAGGQANPFVNRLHVSVSNDGINFTESQEQIAYIYNSYCQTYSKNGTEYFFRLKNDHCFIDGKCYHNGSLHVSQNLTCDPSASQLEWSSYVSSPSVLPVEATCEGSTVCNNEPNGVCEVIEDVVQCSCRVGYAANKRGCERDGSVAITDEETEKHSTDKAKYRVEMVLPFAIPKGRTLLSSRTYKQYTDILHKALEDYYRDHLGKGLWKVVILSVRQGSLVVDHLVIYYNEDFVKGALLEAVALFDRAEISILGNVVTPSGVNVGKEKVSIDGIHESRLCQAMLAIEECATDELCVVQEGLPKCRKTTTTPLETQNASTTWTIITALSTTGGVLVVIVIVLIVVVCKKNANAVKPFRQNKAGAGRVDSRETPCTDLDSEEEDGEARAKSKVEVVSRSMEKFQVYENGSHDGHGPAKTAWAKLT